MTASIDRRSDIPQLTRNVLEVNYRSRIGDVYPLAVREQQLRCRCAASAKAEYRYFGLSLTLLAHLSFSVLNATKAQSIPRIQNRTTT